MRHIRPHHRFASPLRALSLLCVCVIGLGLASAHGARAQATVQQIYPDYAVRSIRPGVPTTVSEFVVEFDVVNNGVPAASATTATLRQVGAMTMLASEPVAALGQGSSLPIRLSFPASALSSVAGSAQLLVRVGVPDIEPENSPNVSNNDATIRVEELRAMQRTTFGDAVIIDGSTAPTDSGVPQPTPIAPVAPTDTSVLAIGDVRISLPFGLKTDDPLLIPGAVLAVAIVLVVVWLLTALLRALFHRAPTFPVWQPPYAQTGYLNPNSPQERRQMWQQHAQSDTLPFPNAGIEYAARKLLIGMDGTKLTGWHVTGLRLVQYDMYGRIQRTNTISTSRIVKPLDRTARKTSGNPRRPLTRKQAEQQVRPVARRALSEFLRQAKRTPSLPVAVDVRFRGERSQVRILFELYQSLGTMWQIMDAWEPEMMPAAGALVENFTYTLFGQRQNEKPRAFRRRLEDELTGLLASMVETPASQLLAPPAPRAARMPRKPAPATEQIPVVVAAPVIVLPPAIDSVSPATASMPPINLGPEAAPAGAPPEADPLLDTAQVRAQTDEANPQP